MKYQIMTTEYLSTGGNCMVTICDVWLPDEFRTVYVYVCDGLSTLVFGDFIRQDIDVDSYEYVIDTYDYVKDDCLTLVFEDYIRQEGDVNDYKCEIDTYDYLDDKTESRYLELHRQCAAIHMDNERK